MNNVMVDNWFMSDLVRNMEEEDFYHSEAYGDLLMAIVLWDEVYYPQNSRNRWMGYSNLQNYLRPLYDDEKDTLFRHPIDRKFAFEYGLKPQASIIDEAWRYMKLSYMNDCDYLPAMKRRTFLLHYSNPKRARDSLFRLKMQGSLNETIEEYYHELYGQLESIKIFSNLHMPPPNFQLNMPVLVQFILDNTPSHMTPIEYAFHLRNEGSVVKYREYLGELEEAVQKWDMRTISELCSASDSIISDVLSMEKKHIGSVKVNVFPTPSILLDFEGASMSFAANEKPSLSFEKSMGKKFHLTFLKDLTWYAAQKLADA